MHAIFVLDILAHQPVDFYFFTQIAGIIVLDDTDSEADIDRSNEQIAAHLRSRLKDASEHESRMRSTISSARRFALDLERTGVIYQFSFFMSSNTLIASVDVRTCRQLIKCRRCRSTS